MCNESEDEDVCNMAHNMPSVNEMKGNEEVIQDNSTYGIQNTMVAHNKTSNTYITGMYGTERSTYGTEMEVISSMYERKSSTMIALERIHASSRIAKHVQRECGDKSANDINNMQSSFHLRPSQDDINKQVRVVPNARAHYICILVI